MKRLCLLLVILPSVLFARVRVAEVHYDPMGADGGLEWIELMNQGAQSVDLDGWLLDADGPNLILPHWLLEPGQAFVVHVNAPAASPPHEGEVWFSESNMGNTHGFVGLWRGVGQALELIEDYMEYGAGGHSWESQAVESGLWLEGEFAPDVDAGHSLLLSNGQVGAAAWSDEENPTPGGTGGTTLAEPVLPRQLRLCAAWPNPFNPGCEVSFELDATNEVKLSVTDVLGREVKVLHDGILSAGLHQRSLYMGESVTGAYFILLESALQRDVMKVLLLK
jgi:hypothetical protein